MAKVIANKFKDKLSYDTIQESWMEYSKNHWKQIRKSNMTNIINSYLEKEYLGIGYNINYLTGLVAFLEMILANEEWDKCNHIPLENGTLDLDSMKIIPHSPYDKLTWQLPYKYNPQATCQPIINWLNESVGGDKKQVELLRAYLNAIITCRVDLQRYLELIGSGGTGKGTFIRLAEMLVSEKNTHVTELKRLENSPFETSKIYGKHLILITDADNYAGDVGVLKALTGQDSLPYEQKYKQAGESFQSRAMIIIAANEPIQSKDYTSGLQRRRITLRFDNKVPTSKRRDLTKEFKPLLPGFLNWVLGLSRDNVTDLLRNTETTVSSLNETAKNNLISTNPLAAWLDERVFYIHNYKTYIGAAKKNPMGEYLKIDEWLYANYVEYCEVSGLKSLALQRFSNLLIDLCSRQLGLEVLNPKKDKKGRFITGLRIKSNQDVGQSPLDAKYYPEYNPKLSKMQKSLYEKAKEEEIPIEEILSKIKNNGKEIELLSDEECIKIWDDIWKKLSENNS
jgi:putative DNA primase/helicase